MTPLAPFTAAQLEAARELVARDAPVTPAYRWPLLCDALGADVWVKHENHTPAGAFKVRGGITYMDALVRREPAVSRVVSATRGNHGQSVARAAVAAGLGVTIVVPHGNSPGKNAAMRAWGADLVEHGRDFQEAAEHAAALAAEHGWHPVPAFHPDLVLGVATYAAELHEQVPDLDVVYVPIGMGSGVCANIAVRDLRALATRVVGVVAAGAPAYALSFAAGRVVTTERADTFVDGVACRTPPAEGVAAVVAGAERVREIGEDDARLAMRLMWDATHQMPEPAGALALAGAWADRDHLAGRRVAVIMTGGNTDADVVRAAMEG